MKRLCILLVTIMFVVGCTTTPPYDYTEFLESKPTSILVLPPLNESTDIAASNSLLSLSTYPLAEGGYYIFPVAVVAETFRQNGLIEPAEIHDVSIDRLHEVFGADTALYINIKEYGTSYQILNSNTVVSANAVLIDLHSGKEIWSGSATANSAEQRGSSGGLAAMLVESVVFQILETVTDKGYEIAGITSNRLLGADGPPNRMLYGPYSPYYGEDALNATVEASQ